MINNCLSSSDAEGLHDAAHLVGDANLLGALGQTFLAVLTGTGPGLGIRQGLAITLDELLLALCIVGGCGSRQGQDVFSDGLIVVCEIARDVDTIRTRHAVFTGGAGDSREARHLVSNVGKQRVLGISADLEWREGGDILFQVIHTVHAAEHGENVGMGSHPTESPASGAVIWAMGFQLIGQFLGHTSEGSTAQRFHDDVLNAEFLTFII